MFERDKIREAEYHLALMKADAEKRFEFKYDLSALLSAARSVLQYAEYESEKTREGRRWYNELMKNTILKFFRDKRNVEIHEKPIEPSAEITARTQEILGISDSISVILCDKDGKIKQEYHSAPPSKSSPSANNVTSITTVFRFSDWSGPEDVIKLCESYIDELKKAVNDGINKGFISG